MDADGRPAKIRKLSHDGEAGTREDLTQDQTHSTPLADPSMDERARPDSEDQDQNEDPAEDDEISINVDELPVASTLPSQGLSKKQLKRLRKREEWEAGREDRKIRRREKTKERRERRRTTREQEALQRKLNGEASPEPKPQYKRPVQLPVAFVIDCGFDDKMVEKERISLGAQITRAYSDNSRAPYQAHLTVSSWGGKLKERFETALHGDYKSWKKIEFTEDDFVVVAEKAKETMTGPGGGIMDGTFRKYAGSNSETQTEAPLPSSGADNAVPDTASTAETPPLPPAQTVYLTSDSPNTLQTLTPNSTYIIGGIVDKNRHKGLCYQVAQSRGVETAKLPIGEFMEMQSRFVLATNHVVEIMIRYLECGDWGEAFMRVIPKRKGGRLKGDDAEGGEEEQEQAEAVVDAGDAGTAVQTEKDGENLGEVDKNMLEDVQGDETIG